MAKRFETVNLASFYKDSGIGQTIATSIQQGPQKQAALLGIHDGISNINATGFTPNREALDPTEFTGIGVPEVFAAPASPTKIGFSPAGFIFSPAFLTPTVTNNMITPANTGLGVSNNMLSPVNAGITVTNNMTPPVNAGLGVVNNMGNPPGTAPSVANNMGNPPGNAPSVTNNMATPNHGVGLLNFVDGAPNINALGFTGEMTSTQFVGISGGPANGTFTYNHTGNQGLGILGIGNFYPDYDQVGFTPNKHHLDASDFIGVGGDPGNMTFTFGNRGGGGQIWAWNRSIYNDKFPQTVPVDGFSNEKADGFILGKSHLGLSDFKGVSFPTPYSYPSDISPFQSYAFTDSIYSNIMDNVSAPTAPGSKDGVGQEYSVSNGGFVSGKKFKFAQGIELQGQFKTTITDLYNSDLLKKDAFNSGYYGDQPYITRAIGSNWSLFADGPGPVHGDTAVRGGLGTSLNRALIDVDRIGQYMLSPNGLIFIAKNIGMQLSNPKWQGATVLGLSRTRVYPLGLSTVAQVATNAAGIHLVRHGLGPLEGDGTHYETTVNEIGRDNYTGKLKTTYGILRGKSRLYALGKELNVGYFDPDTASAGKPKTEGDGIFAKLGRWTKKQLQKLTPSREKIDVLSGLLGPHSVYGIGRTRIFRSKAGFGVGMHTNNTGTHGQSVSLTTSWGNKEEQVADPSTGFRADNPNFGNNGWTPLEGLRYSDNKNGDGDFKSERSADIDKITLQTPPVLLDNAKTTEISNLSHHYETIAYGKIKEIQENQAGTSAVDFRTYLDGDSAASITTTSDQWAGMDRVTRFRENYGKKGKNVSDRLKLPGGFETVGLSDSSVLPDENGFAAPANALNTPEEKGNQAVPFEDLILFQFKTLQPKKHTVQLRAMLTDFTDSLSPSYEDVGYVGRTSPTYLFKSISRATKFSFKMYAMTRQELDAQYIRLNRLMQLISPGFTSGNLPIGPILKLTIGNYFKDTPVVVDSFDISIPDSSPWDIDPGRQLPLYLEVSMGCKVMFNEAPSYDPALGTFTDPDSADPNTQTAANLAVFRTNSNYFNAINQNFGRGAKVTEDA